MRPISLTPSGRPPAVAARTGRRANVTVRRHSKSIRVDTAQVVQAARAALGEHTDAVIHVALVDDAAISALHERFMHDPRPTDVLTFDLRDEPEGRIEGDIVVSLDTAARQARRYSVPPVEEALRYVIHGVLHLLGYDDHTPADRRRMRREENRVLEGLGRRSKASRT